MNENWIYRYIEHFKYLVSTELKKDSNSLVTYPVNN